MRIATVHTDGLTTRYCFVLDEILYDLGGLIDLFLEMQGRTNEPPPLPAGNLFTWRKHEYWLPKIFDFLRESLAADDGRIAASIVPPESCSFLPPVPECPNMFGVVQNSPQFWRKKGIPIVHFPAGYSRPPGSLIGHGQTITLPPYCGSFRCAAEFGVVIGKQATNVNEEAAMDHVFGYTCVNDMISNSWKAYAEAENPTGSPDFFEYLVTSYYGRGTRHFGPVGPAIVTKEEIPDPYNLLLFTRLNHEIKDRSYNNSMIMGIETVIARLSRFMTLPPGAIIHMGTMGTDGITLDEETPLSPDDSIEIDIEKVGILRNTFRDLRFHEEYQ